MHPDERLYGVLISVIGSASLSTAVDLQEDLLQSGAVPLQVNHPSELLRVWHACCFGGLGALTAVCALSVGHPLKPD